MFDLDSVLAEAELESGVPVEVVTKRYPEARVAEEVQVNGASKPPRWSEAEVRFVEERLGLLSMEAIAGELGRSTNAIKIVQTRRGLPAPSKRPGWLTGHQVALLLSVDIHAVCGWTDMGLLPYQVVPGKRRIRTIRYVTLLRWAVNPMNWIYFKRSVDDTRRILEPRLRRLIERQKGRWNDEWWTPSQVAAYHGVEHTDVNRLVHQGKIKGVKWGNWWVLRSEATRPGLMFCKGKGNTQSLLPFLWSERAEAFLIECRAKGMTWAAIARLMKMKRSRLSHHYYWLERHGLIRTPSPALPLRGEETPSPALPLGGGGRQGEQ